MSIQSIIKEVSRNLKIINSDWLLKLINFETAGTFNPESQNPTSSARGLIQFMDKTAQDMGYRDSIDLTNKYPDFETQMKGPVTDYLKRYSPFNTEQELYMAVFLPSYRKKNPDTRFPQWVINANPGIYTVNDYINKVKKKAFILTAKKSSPILIILSFFGYHIWKKYIRN